jgi:hypothetical protein
MKKAVSAFTGITPLNVPVPPMLAKAIGYTGKARFVSFQWTPYGDETDYSDGRVRATGNWQAFLAYIQHPAISPHLGDYDLGSSESEAKHALLLDLDELALYVGPVKEVKDFLSHQKWPTQQPVGMTQAEYAAFVAKALKNVKPPKHVGVEEIQRRIDQQYALVEELQQWLDRQLKN